MLAATDPANPYGADPLQVAAALAGAPTPAAGATRTVGATVILVDGALAAYLARGDRLLLTWLPEAEPERSRARRAPSRTCSSTARARGGDAPRGMLIEEIDGAAGAAHPLAPFLVEAGFVGRRDGLPGDLSSAETCSRAPASDEEPMPEGDTIFRAARTLHRALAGARRHRLRVGRIPR